VVVDAIGATPAQRVGFTNSNGNFQTTFTPQTTGTGLSVLAAFVDATHPYLSTAALNDSTIVGGAVVVTPSQTTIAPGASRQFSAVVEGTSNQAVTWSVTGGGSISATGLFTSNGVVGTFFVRATSVADPSMVGIAQVTVAALTLCEGSCRYDGTWTLCTGGATCQPSVFFNPTVTIQVLSAFAAGNLNFSCAGGAFDRFTFNVSPDGAFDGPFRFAECIAGAISGTLSAEHLTFTILRVDAFGGRTSTSFEGTRVH
jgi:hypothetical protein